MLVGHDGRPRQRLGQDPDDGQRGRNLHGGLLPASMLCTDAKPSLPDYADARVAKSFDKPINPSWR